jgi:two-component system phosphate regulon response regulator OmpR
VNEVSASSAHIVVCDDEADIRETLTEYLGGKGYAVTPANAGPALRALMGSQHVDIVILDIRMPGEDGLSLARYLREHFDIAIIMLTGSSEIIDRVIGLEIGADDYIAKPVDLRELLARVKAVLRRTSARGHTGQKTDAEDQRSVQFGNCRFFPEAHKLFNPEGNEIAITPMEFQLLKVFAEHRGRVLNRDQLLELAHDQGWEPFDRSIDIRVSRLRKKIEADASKPEVIKTVRGVGYVYS